MDLVLLFLMQIFAVFAKHNEWYCQEADQKYQICRKCKTLVENCDKVAPKDCKCENLKFDKNDGSCKLEFIPKWSVYDGAAGNLRKPATVGSRIFHF